MQSDDSDRNQNAFNLTLRSLLAGRFEQVLQLLKGSKGLFLDSVLASITFAGFSFIARGRYTEAEKTFKLFNKVINLKQRDANILKESINDSADGCRNANDVRIPFLVDVTGRRYDSEPWPLDAILNYIYGMKYLNKDVKKAQYHIESASNSYKKLYNCGSNAIEPLLCAVNARDYVDAFYSFKSIKDVQDKALSLLGEWLGDKAFNKRGEDFRRSVEKLNDSIEADLITEDCVGDRLAIHNILAWLQLFCLGSIAWPLEWKERWLEEESPAFPVIVNLENFSLQSWADYALRVFSFNDSLSNLLMENGNKIGKIPLATQRMMLNLLRPDKRVSKKTLSIKLDELKERMEEFGSLLETRINNDSDENRILQTDGSQDKFYVWSRGGKETKNEDFVDCQDKRNEKGEIDVFVDDTGIVYLKGKAPEEFKEAPLLYEFLIYFLMNKGIGGSYANLFIEVWPEGQNKRFDPNFKLSKSQKSNIIRMKNRLNKLFKDNKIKEIRYEYKKYKFDESCEFYLIKKCIC